MDSRLYLLQTQVRVMFGGVDYAQIISECFHASLYSAGVDTTVYTDDSYTCSGVDQWPLGIQRIATFPFLHVGGYS